MIWLILHDICLQSESRNDNINVLYADITPNTATKGNIMVPLHDDSLRVEYAQVQHPQTEKSHIETETSKSINNY